VPRSGNNLPGFRAVQLAFAAHLRDPDEHPPPSGIEVRRLAVYRDLIYNNIENFLAGAFPVAKSVLEHNDRWHGLVRAFVSRHGSESPYFLEIPQEFLAFLAGHDDPALPDFLLELCHYEWVELALAVADDEFPDDGIDPAGSLETGIPVPSPLIWKLGYRYPVHRIGPAFQPEHPEARPTELVVYRRRNDEVGFMEVSGLTMTLLEALDGARSGRDVLQALAASAPQLAPESVYETGLETLERFRKADIVLGSKARESDSMTGDRG
jgi:uncharacterized protein